FFSWRRLNEVWRGRLTRDALPPATKLEAFFGTMSEIRRATNAAMLCAAPIPDMNIFIDSGCSLRLWHRNWRSLQERGFGRMWAAGRESGAAAASSKARFW